MTFNFVEKEFNIGGTGNESSTFQFYKRGFALGGSVSPSWQDIILSGNTALTLVNSKADGLNYVKLFGATENVPETYLDTVTLSGGCTQSSTPTPANPVPIVCNNGEIKSSKNLLKPTTATATSYFIPQADGSVVCQGTPTEYVSLLYYTYVLSDEPLSGKYTFGFFGNSTNASYRVALLDSSSTTLITLTVADSNTTRTFDLSEYPTAYYIRIILMRTSNNTAMSGTLYPYFVKGETGLTEWRSYKEVYTDGTVEVVTDNAGNTATAEMLLAVDTYKDVQSVIDGSATRNVGIKVLDGTENWTLYPTISGLFYSGGAIRDNKIGASPLEIMSNQYFATDNLDMEYNYSMRFQVSAGVGVSSHRLYVRNTDYSTAEEFKQYLAEQFANGTPVIITYPLETPTTETVSAQVLTKSPVTQTAGSINNLPIAYTESSHTTPKPVMPLDIVCNNGVLKVKNLYNGTTATITGNKYSYTQTATGFTATAQASTTSSSRINLFCPISWFKLGETYSISGYGDFPTAIGKATPSSSTGAGDYKGRNSNNTFTVSSIDEGQQYVSIAIYFGAQDEGTTFSCPQIQLEQGDTVTSYLPYGQTYADGTTETIEVDTTGDTATATMLNGIGTYKDVQEVLTGGVTKNIEVKVLDGTESWTTLRVDNNTKVLHYNFNAITGIVQTIDYLAICDRYRCIRANNSGTRTNGDMYIIKLANDTMRLDILDDRFETNDAWIAYLQEQYANGTPVIIVCVKATPTTETVTPQPLSIQAGTNIITAEGSIDNLPLEVSYKAGVSVTITEIENAQLDNNVEVTING